MIYFQIFTTFRYKSLKNSEEKVSGMAYLDVFKFPFSKIVFDCTALDIKCRSGLGD